MVSLSDLRQVVALQDLSDVHLQWILDHSELKEYQDGDLVAKYGDPAEVMWMLLCGKVSFYMYQNGRQVYYFTFENNDLTGGIGGLIPYSRMKTYPGYSYAIGEVRLLRMHKEHFHELEQLNPDFIQRLIGIMTERARVFATQRLQLEKVEALGNLAAGIAHELNNPAAAIRGISEALSERLKQQFNLIQQLTTLNLSGEQFAKLKALAEKNSNAATGGKRLSTLQKLEMQDEMESWLEENGIDFREAAETFSENGISTEELEQLQQSTGKEAFLQLIPWLENAISCAKSIKDLNEASCRISDLVGSIKSHVHMDQTNDLQQTDIHTDLDNTVTLLGFKLRAKNIKVVKKYSADMPPVPAYIGELNQVWTNLIDNAIAAMDKDGELTLETSVDGKNANICVIDNGPGIPANILSRIFDPFFTTKKVGEGTGIGLDIVNRVIKHHNGEVKVNSRPGHTQFSICLPLEPVKEPVE